MANRARVDTREIDRVSRDSIVRDSASRAIATLLALARILAQRRLTGQIGVANHHKE